MRSYAPLARPPRPQSSRRHFDGKILVLMARAQRHSFSEGPRLSKHSRTPPFILSDLHLVATMAAVDSDFSMMQDESDDDFSMSDGENMAVPAKAVKASSKGAPLAVLSPNKPAVKKSGKTVESQYRKLSQREHCLVRPDTYIGSVEPVTESMFVLDEATERLVNREITFTPGLYKIFDESKCRRVESHSCCFRPPVVSPSLSCSSTLSCRQRRRQQAARLQHGSVRCHG